MSRTTVAVTVAAGAALVGCGSASSAREGTAGTPALTRQAPATGRTAAVTTHHRASLTIRRSPYGRILFDGRRRVLYLFTRDRWLSRCYGACAKAWPPFLARERPRANGAVAQRLIGSVRRRNGERQVTYRGHPLYYYVGDRRPGQILCQDVFEFGGRWLVVAPSGVAVR
jgi:predicted lipoprotein with Yx(FWY)xxD motif